MPKIELPPKVKCPEPGCREGLIPAEDVNGIITKWKPCPRCHGDGEIYLFEDLAAAVADAGLRLEFQQQYGPLVEVYYRVHLICGCSGAIVSANGKTPTLALLAAIKAVNEREEK